MLPLWEEWFCIAGNPLTHAMNWTQDALAELPDRDGFRLRGENMTRMEVFSDAAFAFGVTMLVVSVGSVPGNYDELILALKKVPSFALSFAQIMAFWVGHRMWSQRFGLEDRVTMFLTLLMIFFVLVYVYPLRLIFSTMLGWMTGGWLPMEYLPDTAWEIQGLFGIYGIGFSLLSATLGSLYFRCLRCGDQLGLSAYERVRTQEGVAIWSIQSCVGLFSALWALTLPTAWGVNAGFMYFILPIAMPVCAVYFHRKAQIAREN